MAWVRWSRVCVSKKSGGLGIRNMELFNLSLLGKWRWRVKVERDSDWGLLLKRLYGDDGILRPKQASVWWKDLFRIDDDNSAYCGWLEGGTKKKIGDGKCTKFWTEELCGIDKMVDLFPNLYQLTLNKDCTVAVAEGVSASGGKWRFRWSRELSVEEQAEAGLLQNILVPIQLDYGTADRWIWMYDVSKNYTAKSAYKLLIERSGDVELDEDKLVLLNCLWKSAAPSKFLVFGWRLLVGGLPTRVELKKRGVLREDQSEICVLCGSEVEDSSHLFFMCETAAAIWQQVFIWCGVSFHQHSDAWEHFKANVVVLHHKKRRRIQHLVWIATAWVIWMCRNSIIFRGVRVNINSMVQNVKSLVWGWFINKVDINSTISFEGWRIGTLRSCF